ncbi:polysaccharide export protein [Oculatella sp. LEGE 06141]|uniref:polysaccharide biosynthesis/export family protein n=1 Tax=Oculatella sp. LEGE 06141 TaxID=1828648 RepID=UPI00187F7CF9|nr:polysaccharide biosynthesis/export family protein [Oculatella sp. LEGE 06141]MBE9179717.1 polysaccharide export protein [Oculatella sp. LEGE 06141]
MPKSFGLRQTTRSIAAAVTCCLAVQLPGLAQVPGSASALEPAPIDPAQLAPAQPPAPALQPSQFGTVQTNPAQPQAAPAPSGSISSEYVLGPGDQVEISVFGYEEYTGSKVILPDGTITLPLIGSVPASQRTSDQLARDLTARLSPFLVNPAVTVSLSTLRPVVVNVAGEVQRPGPVQLRSLTTNTISNQVGSSTNNSVDRSPTISSALVEAGGVTQSADIRQVVVRRTLPGGNSTTSTINLWDALWSENAPPSLVLQDGDSLFVPRLEPGETLDRRLVARSSLAPDTIRVRVVGEVTRPGEVQVPPNSTISSAVAVAGGPTGDAKLSEVVYVRLNEEGQIDRQVIDLRNLTDNFQVQEGDVVIVPETRTSSVLDFVGRVLSPLNFLFNVFR